MLNFMTFFDLALYKIKYGKNLRFVNILFSVQLLLPTKNSEKNPEFLNYFLPIALAK